MLIYARILSLKSIRAHFSFWIALRRFRNSWSFKTSVLLTTNNPRPIKWNWNPPCNISPLICFNFSFCKIYFNLKTPFSQTANKLFLVTKLQLFANRLKDTLIRIIRHLIRRKKLPKLHQQPQSLSTAKAGKYVQTICRWKKAKRKTLSKRNSQIKW